MVRIRIRAHPQKYKHKSYNLACKDDGMAGSLSNSVEMNFQDDIIKPASESEGGNKVMVVVDFSPEAKNALEWALSHTVQTHDTVLLLFVIKQGEKDVWHKVYGHLGSMKKICEMSCPGVNVEATVVEGKERGPKIVEEAMKQRASLLVLGQRKRTLRWRLRSMCIWKRRNARKSVVEYCIQNANCMTIAVRRRSKKCGGYSVTTKRHKNFWLLA